MKNFNISANIHICTYTELSEQEKNLVDAAKKTALDAYTPYSHFNVGAAILLGNGEIVSGNNQENAAYPSGLCAERTTLFYANASHPKEYVDTIAIAAYSEGRYTSEPITPCGSCRQVILETQNRYKHPVKLILYGESEIYKIEKITDILPLSFGSDNLYTNVK
jgi:Cytidine deaminase